jgi:hypothetical protein
MGQKLTLEYDRIGDTLFIQTCPPYRGQESDELGNELLGRFNPKTGALECVEIMFFTKRFARRRELKIPFAVEMRPRPSRARPAAQGGRPAGRRG